MAEAEELTLLGVAFVAEYIISENATRSYRKAFKQVRGVDCTYGTARAKSCLLLATDSIQEEIKAERADLRKRCRAKTEKVIRELGKIAFSDIDDILDLEDPANIRLKPRKEIPAAARQVIQEVSHNEFGVKIKLMDKLGALRELACIFGLHHEPDSIDVLISRIPPHCREPASAAIKAAMAASVLASGDDAIPGSKELTHLDRAEHDPSGDDGPDDTDADGGLEPGPLAD